MGGNGIFEVRMVGAFLLNRLKISNDKTEDPLFPCLTHSCRLLIMLIT